MLFYVHIRQHIYIYPTSMLIYILTDMHTATYICIIVSKYGHLGKEEFIMSQK